LPADCSTFATPYAGREGSSPSPTTNHSRESVSNSRICSSSGGLQGVDPDPIVAFNSVLADIRKQGSPVGGLCFLGEIAFVDTTEINGNLGQGRNGGYS